jgi:hypothetical protein
MLPSGLANKYVRCYKHVSAYNKEIKVKQGYQTKKLKKDQKMRVFVNVLIVTLAVIGSAIAGEFIPPNGFPKYKIGAVDCPSNYETGSVCYILAEPFVYVGVYNGKKIAFQAEAGLLTDGASIPKATQGLTGKPHDKEFRRAAVIHDHYVLKENAVYDYFLVQRVFHDILIESGVTPEKANAMYLAVLVFAPKWSLFYSAKPDECEGIPDGVYCARSSEKNLTVLGTTLAKYKAMKWQKNSTLN